MPEPSKEEIEARAYQLWEQAGSFGTWLNRSCATRTNPRQCAPPRHAVSLHEQ
nr:DUF2934 domain-containing protein [Bradyrhizobium paxllaeri]